MAKMTLDDLVAQLLKAYGDELTAVVLYGSAAAGEHIARRSDYNVLVIVRSLGVEQLRAASAVARAWNAAGNPAPLTMTEAEWRRSADIFPMEYADILERHRVLHGTPPFDGVAVSPKHLRLELEQQAMGKLLHLRQGVLASGGDSKLLLELLEASLSTFMVIFRAAARLHGESPSTDYEALSEATARRVGFDAAPFVRVARHVRGTSKLTMGDVPGTVAGYVTGAEQLVAHLDQYHHDNP
jgi:hypothetical protein